MKLHIGALAAVLASSGCLLEGYEPVSDTGSGGTGAQGASGGVGIGGTGGSGGSGALGGAGGSEDCAFATAPTPPSSGDGTSLEDIVVALRSVDFGETPESAETIGLDLDAIATQGGSNRSCVPQSAATCTPDAPCADDDYACGVDNSFRNNLLFGLSTLTGSFFSSSLLSQSANNGNWSVLLRIRGYNGSPNDPKVEVAWFVPAGFPGAPEWAGIDAWPINETSVNESNLDAPKFVDANAYVAQGRLFASLGQVAFRVGDETGEGLDLAFSDARLLASLEQDPVGRWYFPAATLSARWPSVSVFDTVGSYRSETGVGICKDDGNGFPFNAAKASICQAQDILTGSGGPTQECDAISIGFEFVTSPALLGGVVTVAPPPASGCAAGQDPSDEAC